MWQCVSVGNVAVCLCVCVTVHQAVWMCARQCGQCVPLVQKLANEAGRSQGGEKTQAVINRQTDVVESFSVPLFADGITVFMKQLSLMIDVAMRFWAVSQIDHRQ